ncbi:hypothetical protein DICSQDRAFT_151274 [Dichomitus squalens LYAD-421 SS1]|uniref:uncharacterized protein n=1 Tax=Dichomitus squalens (strain LYAD-421) TaxID=732165 RepID=UPI0004414D9D|nr:uncharacterized protein DICSQDRAFT_151274 [Dichomitus squalens LYAD-421 SS1]EJF66871.1 hypothetical protein DICSQDRAFT_151274 [Dichomitus squalens LYAD-421 SS1]
MLNAYGSELPVELYIHICGFLNPSSSPDNIKTLVNLSAVNSYVRAIVARLSIWKVLYEDRYTHDVPEKEASRRQRFGDDWRGLYFERRALDHRALDLVDKVRTEIPGRAEHALVLAKDLSFDVWDALYEEIMLPVPPYFRSDSDPCPDEPAAPHALPRSYWAKAVQGVIARHWAVTIWHGAAQNHLGIEMEDMLAAWSAFFGWSPHQIRDEFDESAEECRTLHGRETVWDQDDPNFDLRRACDTIIDYMRSQDWIGNAFDPDVDEYIVNSYPHTLLMEARDFPLTTFSKTWIFLCLCNHLGLLAYATLVPQSDTAVCVVHTGKADHDPLLINLASDTSFYPASDLPVLKKFLDENGYLPPLSVRWFFLQSIKEAARNFTLYNEHRVAEWSESPLDRALLASHAAQCALATTMIPSKDTFIVFPEGMADFLPLDAHVILLDALFYKTSDVVAVNNTHVEAVKQMAKQLEDLEKLVTRPSQFPGHDLGAIGKVVTAQPAQGDKGVIIGWTSSRDDSEIVLHKVAFPHGVEYWRKAELEYAGLPKEKAQRLHNMLPQFGRYVEDVSFSEVDSEGNPTSFVLTAEMKTLYPDDNML